MEKLKLIRAFKKIKEDISLINYSIEEQKNNTNQWLKHLINNQNCQAEKIDDYEKRIARLEQEMSLIIKLLQKDNDFEHIIIKKKHDL